MQTVTFYSYKGGTGRTLLLANLARLAASLGRKVVALDFDLEAPGLLYKLFRSDPGRGPRVWWDGCGTPIGDGTGRRRSTITWSRCP